jgi:hypothetical protein
LLAGYGGLCLDSLVFAAQHSTGDELNAAGYDERGVSHPRGAALRKPACAERSRVFLKPFKGELQ